MAKSNLLTAVFVKNIARAGIYNDGNGLLLVVSPAGSKSWIMRTRWKGKRPEIGLGSFLDVSLAEARDKRDDIQRAKRKGIDPRLALKTSSRGTTAPTFNECAKQFISDKRAGWSNAKHAAQWGSTLETYAGPHIGKLPVDQVELDHIEAILRPIWASKTETASRVRGRIENILSWAIVKGYRKPPNPAIWRGNLEMLFPSKSKVHTPKHFNALPWVDLPKFMVELRKGQSLSALALEFTILTTARTGEVIAAKWDETNGDTWIIPAYRMKAKREHRVPLVPRVLEILKQIPRVDDGRYIFPGTNGHMSNMTMLSMLQKHMNRPELTVHGFRSTFKDWSVEESPFPGELSEAQLAHTISNHAQAAYERGDKFNKRRELLLAWEKHCG